MRSACSTSQSPSFRKEVWLTFDRGESPAIAALAVGAKPAHAAIAHGVTANARDLNDMPWRPTPGEQEPGALAIAWPILVPSELRHYFTSACADATAEVTVKDTRRRPARAPFYFAKTAAARQRRRKTWTWRRSLNQLPDDAQVDIALSGATAIARILIVEEHDLRKAA